IQGATTLRTATMVGRAEEQAQLRELLFGLRAGHGALVLIGGEAGIGKTSLVRGLAREAAEREMPVLVGHSFDLATTPPYGPWLDLFASYAPTDGRPDAPEMFAGGHLQEVTDRSALFADVRTFLSQFTAGRPTLLLLEDMHWSDPSSVELLRS